MQTFELEQVVALNDPATGLLGFIVIHDTTRGPGIGGLRLWPYASTEAALGDAISLAIAMTRKCALSGLNAGGAKGVLIDHGGITDRPAMWRALGRYVESLGGRFYTSGDLGVGPEDLIHVRETSRFVAVPDRAQLDLSGATARCVVEAMRCTLASLRLGRDLRGRRVAVQGVGEMGGRVATLLLEAGAQVLVADPIAARVDRLVRAGAVAVSVEAIYDQEVDIFSPCATSYVLDGATGRRLRARAVVGAANNQLAAPEVDDLLMARGIRYAPDFAVNAGAVILTATHHLELGFDPADTLARAAERTGDNVRRIFTESDTSGEAPGAVADRLAQAALVRPRSTDRQWWPVR